MGRAHAPAGGRARRARDLRRTAASARSPGTPRATSSSTSPRRAAGRVLHTLNIRLFPDDIVYIADHAEDEVVFVDRSLLKVFWPLVDRFETVKHVVVMDDGVDDEIPDDPRVHDYETLLAEAEPVEFPTIDDENQAAAMCYTSGTTGHPKGVVYSHRSTVLHSMGALVADAAGVSRARHRDAGRADVPRQRVGPLPGGGDGGRDAGDARRRRCSRRRSPS